jgi:hypothetical protein
MGFVISRANWLVEGMGIVDEVTVRLGTVVPRGRFNADHNQDVMWINEIMRYNLPTYDEMIQWTRDRRMGAKLHRVVGGSIPVDDRYSHDRVEVRLRFKTAAQAIHLVLRWYGEAA